MSILKTKSSWFSYTAVSWPWSESLSELMGDTYYYDYDAPNELSNFCANLLQQIAAY